MQRGAVCENLSEPSQQVCDYLDALSKPSNGEKADCSEQRGELQVWSTIATSLTKSATSQQGDFDILRGLFIPP